MFSLFFPHYSQLLLWPFQSFSDSKGFQYLRKKYQTDLDENDGPFFGFDQRSLSDLNVGNFTILGEGPRENVKFEWLITPWSECTLKCGPEKGMRVSK